MKLASVPIDAPIEGEFAALFAQLDTPCEAVTVMGGYVALLARVATAEFRTRCGLVRH